MSCENFRESLQDWFDQPGSPSLNPEVAEHVKECADCRAFATRWNRIELQIQQMREEGPELSPDFADRLREKLAQRRPIFAWPQLGYGWRMAGAGATAVVVVVAALYVLSGLHIISPMDYASLIPWFNGK